MDEVARERASAAHARLDGINGQIAGLRVAQDKTRDDVTQEVAETREGLYAAMGKLWDAHSQTANMVAEMRGTFGTALKVAGAIGLAMLALLGSLLAYTITHTPQAAPRNATDKVEKATGRYSDGESLASRQRGAHGRMDGP